MKFSFTHTYFIAVCSKFTGSNYELCSPTNYNIGRILKETRLKQQLFGPKSVEFLHCWRSQQRDATSDLEQATHQACFYALGNPTLQYSKNIDFLSSLPKLGKIYVTVFFYVLLFQVCPGISALWMDPKRNDTMGSCLYSADWEDEFGEKS